MHDVGYVAAGYAVTLLTIGGYRWRLAVRARRARTLLNTLTGRRTTAAARDGR
jgi:hypothetical protein